MIYTMILNRYNKPPNNSTALSRRLSLYPPVDVFSDDYVNVFGDNYD